MELDLKPGSIVVESGKNNYFAFLNTQRRFNFIDT